MILRLLIPLGFLILAGCAYTSTGRRIDTPSAISKAGYPYVFVRLDGDRGKAYSEESPKRVTVSVVGSSGEVASKYVEELYGADLIPLPSWNGMELSIKFTDRQSSQLLAERRFSVSNGTLKLINEK